MMVNSLTFIGQKVNVVIDRPLGSKHPKHGFTYEVNYGYIPNTKSADGEELDAYVLGVDKPITEIKGVCVAVIRRTDDDDDKLIVTPNGEDFSDIEIEKLTQFQEKWFKHVILRMKI
jgi:inorganic pyrophosphatase